MNKVTICIIAVVLYSCNLENKAKITNDDVHKQSIHFDLKDTIPNITLTDTSLAFPQIFEGSFELETKIKQLGTEITFDRISVGKLKISSGKIIATDPTMLHDAVAFNEKFPIGEFPVELAVAKIKANSDRRIAFARLRFSDKPVKKWEFALLPGQIAKDIKSTEQYGYGVDAGVGLFIDQVAQNSLNVILDKNWENIFSEKFEDYLNYDFQNQNVVFFSTGFGDGFYSTYIGRDADGEICQLLTDFSIVKWWNLNKS